jgi:hypothetical protein
MIAELYSNHYRLRPSPDGKRLEGNTRDGAQVSVRLEDFLAYQQLVRDAARARATNAAGRLAAPILAGIVAAGVLVPENWLGIAVEHPEYNVRITAPG